MRISVFGIKRGSIIFSKILDPLQNMEVKFLCILYLCSNPSSMRGFSRTLLSQEICWNSLNYYRTYPKVEQYAARQAMNTRWHRIHLVTCMHLEHSRPFKRIKALSKSNSIQIFLPKNSLRFNRTYKGTKVHSVFLQQRRKALPSSRFSLQNPTKFHPQIPFPLPFPSTQQKSQLRTESQNPKYPFLSFNPFIRKREGIIR